MSESTDGALGIGDTDVIAGGDSAGGHNALATMNPGLNDLGRAKSSKPALSPILGSIPPFPTATPRAPESAPYYDPQEFFAEGVKHQITVIKKDCDLFLRVENPDRIGHHHFRNTRLRTPGLPQ